MINTRVMNGLKLVGAGATIAAVGWGILTFGHDARGPVVQEAEADILALDFAPSKTATFVEALDDLGMEEPRAYDWNGNKMFFSTTTTEEAPREVLARFQNKFQEVGLNKVSHREKTTRPEELGKIKDITKASKADQLKFLKTFSGAWNESSDFLSGGIVPTNVSDNYVSMAGSVSRNSADDGLDFLKEVSGKEKSKDLRDHIGGMRNIEVFKMSKGSRITAVWSDEELDMKKFGDTRSAGQGSGNANVPACPGCVRIMKLKAESEVESGYVTTLFEGSPNTASQKRFYRWAMAKRGWKEASGVAVLERAEADGLKAPTGAGFLAFEKEGKFMNVMFNAKPNGKTMVQVMESP